MKPFEKLIAVRREIALRRPELRHVSTDASTNAQQREFAPGTATYPIKAPDQTTRRLVEAFLAHRDKQQ